MQLAIDTKSDLGVLVSKRLVKVEEPSPYEKRVEKYREVMRQGDQRKIEKARAELLSKGFKRVIKPGEECAITGADRTNRGKYPGADKLDAVIRWYPEKEYLRAEISVTDAQYSTDADPRWPWDASSVGIYVCPSGAPEDINQIFFVPEGEDGTARVSDAELTVANPDGIRATWERTEKGYDMELRIPWAALKGYKPGWNLMPVTAMINSKLPGGRVQILMTPLDHPWESAHTYVVLKAR